MQRIQDFPAQLPPGDASLPDPRNGIEGGDDAGVLSEAGMDGQAVSDASPSLLTRLHAAALPYRRSLFRR
jgi:hypothetical protein